MTPRELPAVDAARCVGCGDCVAVCPADCLAMAGPVPWLPRPGDCVSCTACALVCPADAVRPGSIRPPDNSFGDGPGGGG